MRPSERILDRGPVAPLAAVLLALVVWPAAASSFDEAMDVRKSGNSASQQSQKRIDQLAEETDVMLAEYKTALSQIDALRTYNKQVEGLIADQERDVTQLNEEIDGVELVSRQVSPLMAKMIDGLDKFVELDVPFLASERANRVASLRELMARADVSDAEKYRRITESFQIENDYGRTIEAYKGPLIQEGTSREVSFLRIGRIALVYQTLDGLDTGVWDQKNGKWVKLGSDFRSPIKQGLRIARKQAAPDLILVPLAAAEGN